MKRRLLKWLLVFAGLALAGFVCFVWLAPSGGINRMTVLHIRAGMSYDEVDAVIGLPHGDHCSTPGWRVVEAMNVRFWHGDAGAIKVRFDDNGKVTTRSFSPSVPSFFDKVYQWVGVDTNVPRIPILPLPSRPWSGLEPIPRPKTWVNDQP